MAQGGFQRFLEAWRGEFSRSVEMFTGESVSLECRVLEPGSAPGRLDQFVWWREMVHADGEHVVWVGLPDGVWEMLGESLGSDSESQRQVCLEMFSQALHGAAHLLSSGLPKPMSVWDGKVETLDSLEGLENAAVQLRLGMRELPDILVCIESKFAQALERPDKNAEPAAQMPKAPAAAPSPAPDANYNSAFNRLIDLELPMAVALGRATLPVREVLKITTGSLIELDHKLGDLVEVLVHGKVVARGEVVSVKGNYGVRIHEIIDRRDRLALRHGPPTGPMGTVN